MSTSSYGRGTVRFVLSQLGVSALVLAVLFLVPISMLLERQVREGESADAIAAQTQVLQQISRLAESIERTGSSDGALRRMTALVHAARANDVRLALDVPAPAVRSITRAFTTYADDALVLAAGKAGAERYRRMVDLQLDLTQKLAMTDRARAERTRHESTGTYAMIGCAIVALLMLLGSGWGSLMKSSRTEERLRERVADAAVVDVQTGRMEELYLIVASSGVDPARQIERALDYARTALDFEWAIAIEWMDGDEPAVISAPGSDLVSAPDDAFALETAIALEAGRAGHPVTLRFDRLPAELAPLANAPRPFAWRHCAAYTFPGDYADRSPHCALFLGSRRPRVDGFSESDQQLLRLIGTLVASSGRNMRHQKRLDGLAFADPLTGMPNRALLHEQLERAILEAERTGGTFAIHYIDLDGFKRVNDEDGHEIGDEVLKIAAKRMEKVLREGDTLARIGGDEFVVLQASGQTRAQASEVAQRVIERLDRPFTIDGRKHRIGGSIGIALYPEHGFSTSELLRHADSALYTSKRNGKGRWTFYSPVVVAAPAADVARDDVARDIVA